MTRLHRCTALWVGLCTSLLLGTVARSASVDLASAPLTVGLSKVVPPNLFLLMDTSASTDLDYMPDAVGANLAKACYRNFGHNKLAYNPAIAYTPPPLSDSAQAMENAQYTEAWVNGFNHDDGTTDLSTPTITEQAQPETLGANPFSVVLGSRVVTVTQAAHGYSSGTNVTFTNLRTSSGSSTSSVGGIQINGRTFAITVINANQYSFIGGSNATSTRTGGGSGPIATTYVSVALPTYYSEYTASPASPPDTCEDDAAYTKKTPTTAAEKTNFANWYSYYRKRLLTLKSTFGRSFANLDPNYRVGWSATTYSGNSNDSGKFRRIAPFTNSNRNAIYNNIYSASSSGQTPLRAALAKAGRMYAGAISTLTGANDPVLYSCQQNFALLITDGYWTTGSETPTYGPFKIDGTTTVGDQDGNSATTKPPRYDGLAVGNTLADVAAYYYNTDLRTSGQTGGPVGSPATNLDVSANDVPKASADSANWQHMNTFTLGLGVNGELAYSPSYLQGGSAEYNALLAGTKNWPDPQPTNTGGQITSRIDDLWHAAVNGRGQYFSASNPDSVITGIKSALASISKITSAAAAAATSNLEPVAGDNYAYVAQFSTVSWSGELQARSIDLTTGAVSENAIWSARNKLASKVAATTDTRTIYTWSGSGASKLKPFTSPELGTEISNGWFRASSYNPNGALSHYSSLNDTQKSNANTAANMIGWIRGQTRYEALVGNVTDEQVYRARETALGDIVDSAPVYVKKPPFSYVDPGYASFITAQSSRQAMVYVGANDGMLHAFNADTGEEQWAYIPAAVVPYLYKLADTDYANRHRNLVNGTLTVGDVYDSATSTWKTILVGMLGAGGRGLFALDITDPASPKGLWEFTNSTDADLGYTLGNALITKRNADGKWVVVFASGYNNTNGSSTTAKARLFVVDALTGTKLTGGAGEIEASEETSDPNATGIARITGYVAAARSNNTTRYVYGGSLSGSLFRFDLDGGTAQRLGKTDATAGNRPITARPEVATVKDQSGTSYRVVYVATGRYLGSSDLATTSTSSTVQQAIFAVKDSGSDLGALNASGASLVEQTIDTTTSPSRIPNPQPVDWSGKNGWFVKLPLDERVTVDPRLQVGTLVVLSNTPKDDYCYTGGTSTQYALAYRDGTAISSQTQKNVGTAIGSSLASGLNVIKLPSGKLVSIITQADTTLSAAALPVDANMGLTLRRVSWKELF